jgi:hypothetical protein
MELVLRAIMEIRAPLSSITRRAHEATVGANQASEVPAGPFIHSSFFRLANRGGTSQFREAAAS